MTQFGRNINIFVNKNDATQVSSQRLEHISSQVLTSIFAFVNTGKRTFHRVDAWRCFKFLEKSNSSCRFLRFLNTKSGILKGEIGINFTEHIGEHSAPCWRFFLVTTVHKNVLLTTMAMQIAKKHTPSLLFDTLD